MDLYKGNRKDDWETPGTLFCKLDKVYRFRLDLAADFVNAKTEYYFDVQDDSLNQNWTIHTGNHWLNPPYSEVELFLSKAAREQNPMIAIYKAVNLETALWQDIILPNAAWVCFLRGRVNYVGEELKNGVPFGSALIGYRIPCYPTVEKLGKVWQIR